MTAVWIGSCGGVTAEERKRSEEARGGDVANHAAVVAERGDRLTGHVDGADQILDRLAVGGERRGALILAADIECHRPGRSPHRSPAHHV